MWEKITFEDIFKVWKKSRSIRGNDEGSSEYIEFERKKKDRFKFISHLFCGLIFQFRDCL